MTVHARRRFVAPAPQTCLVLFAQGAFIDAAAQLQDLAHVILVPALAAPMTAAGVWAADAHGIVLEKLEAAVVRLEPDAFDRVRAATGPSRIFHSAEPIGSFSIFPTFAGGVALTGRWADDAAATWGIHAVGRRADTGDGDGVRVAILDTGFGPCVGVEDRVTARNFDALSSDTHDGNGHGTMCAAIACGGARASGQRYGVAAAARIFVAKVCNAAGIGAPGAVLAGLEWAVAQRCQVVSMSLGLDPSFPPLKGLDELTQRAFDNGTLPIAASGDYGPATAVVQPASAPAVLAIGAIDSSAQPYAKGCSSGTDPGAAVDLSAPGVDVSARAPDLNGEPRYCVESGTSLAAPFVAGIAALLFAGGLPIHDVRQRLSSAVMPLADCRAQQCGAGLVQAP